MTDADAMLEQAFALVLKRCQNGLLLDHDVLQLLRARAPELGAHRLADVLVLLLADKLWISRRRALKAINAVLQD
jgi:hypothetical protein